MLLLTSSYFKTLMNSIQYKALRIIFKAPARWSSTWLHKKANIPEVEDRLNSLGKFYLDQAIINRSPVITLLTEGITNSVGIDWHGNLKSSSRIIKRWIHKKVGRPRYLALLQGNTFNLIKLLSNLLKCNRIEVTVLFVLCWLESILYWLNPK